MDERQEIKSLKKALRALTFLNCHGESTVTEVALAIGVPRTTSYRLLETLASEGYVEKQAHSHIYRLTSMVQKLSSGFGESDLVVEVAKPLINRFGSTVRWPLAMATPQGSDMMVRVATDHDTPLAIDRYFIGFRVSMLHAPAGLCYLAYCDPDRSASLLELLKPAEIPEGERAWLSNLEFTLDRIRRCGFCHIRFAQYREGGLAVPLFADGKVVGGIVMRYMKASIKAQQLEDHYVPILLKLASAISTAYDRRVDSDCLSPHEVDIDLESSMSELVADAGPFSLVGALPSGAIGRPKAELQRALPLTRPGPNTLYSPSDPPSARDKPSLSAVRRALP